MRSEMHFRLSLGSVFTSFPQASGLVYCKHSLEMIQDLIMLSVKTDLR